MVPYAKYSPNFFWGPTPPGTRDTSHALFFPLHSYDKGGGGFTLFFVVVKLDFEIAVDQQTKAHDQTFEGIPDSGCP